MQIQTTLAIVAGTMGFIMALAPALQISRILSRHHSDDVSLLMPIVIAVGAGSWAAYGLALGDIALILPNAFGVLTNVVLAVIIIRYRSGRVADKRRSSPEGAHLASA